MQSWVEQWITCFKRCRYCNLYRESTAREGERDGVVRLGLRPIAPLDLVVQAVTFGLIYEFILEVQLHHTAKVEHREAAG